MQNDIRYREAKPDPLYFLSARQRAEYGTFVRDVFRDFDARDPRSAGRELLKAAFPSGRVNEYTLKSYLRRWKQAGYSDDHILAAMGVVAATPDVRRPFKYMEKVLSEWKRPRAEPSGRSQERPSPRRRDQQPEREKDSTTPTDATQPRPSSNGTAPSRSQDQPVSADAGARKGRTVDIKALMRENGFPEYGNDREA